MKGKIYTQTELDKAVKGAYLMGYEKGREEGYEAASEAHEYEGE